LITAYVVIRDDSAAAASAADDQRRAAPGRFARGQRLIGHQIGCAANREGQQGQPRALWISVSPICATHAARYAEDRVASAVAAGVRQYVVLGAGLDTFAYRSPMAAARVRVFEVDHPDTQDWKRSALAAARIGVPPRVVFVPADLAAGSLAAALGTAGFDYSQPAVISWLGVIMYLDRAAIGQTLGALAACAPGTELIADYMLPQALRDEAGNGYAELIMAATAEHGEPWLSFFAPGEMAGLLAEHGFREATQVRQRESVPAEMWQRADALQPIELSMIACARLGGK
jgi:methyltransferase (TIGR00027 family)